MLDQILSAKTEEDKSNESNNTLNSESEHTLIINWTPLNKKKFFLKRGYKSPRMLSKSVPRRNQSLLRYRMNRSLSFDITSRKDNWLKSANSSFDKNNSFDEDKSSRDLSRSAKIMRALSFSCNLLSHRNLSTKRSLNFDSTPSPEKNTSSDGSSHTGSINITVPDSNSSTSSPSLGESLKLDSNSTDSTASSMLIVSLESMDENQNRTPQHNRKLAKISSNRTSDAKESVNESGSSCSTSSLRSSLKKRIDNIISMAQTPNLQSFKRNKSNVLDYVMVASTPRNLFQEFNQEEHNRPHTPENMMRLIPESMSSIKKSHKKEKLYRHEEELLSCQTDIRNENFHTRAMVKSLETDDMSATASCNTASTKESQKKNKIIKKMLVYDSDDKFSDTTSILDDNVRQKTTPKKGDFSENKSDKIKNNKIRDIDSSDCEKCDKDSDSSIHFASHDDRGGNCSKKNARDKEVYQSPLQRELSSTRRINVTNEKKKISTESNLPASQNVNATTPKNSINIVEFILTESIKKSHKKIKHENRKAFISKSLYEIATTESEMLAQDTCNNDQREDMKNKAVDAVCASSSKNFDRPNTPENLNSSRLLLPLFNSVKKSHKKDKDGKRISGLAKCQKYHEHHQRYQNTNKSLHRDESLKLKESPKISPNKRKKSMNMSSQSGTCKFSYSSESPSSKYKNAGDEFKIFTPIKKVPSVFTVTNCARADEMSQEKNEFAQEASKEVSCTRCMTPIARYTEKLHESKDLISEKYANAIRFETDARASNDEPAGTANLKNENGRSTPINMSTAELLCDINSIKKSHKKNKHGNSTCRKRVLEKNQSCRDPEGSEDVNVASSVKILEKHRTLNSPQPSTSRTNDTVKNTKKVKESELLNTTPPNDLDSAHFIKLHTTSIKKSHKKERDHNAQAKYILLNKELELSDDGSIFGEENILNFAERFDPH